MSCLAPDPSVYQKKVFTATCRNPSELSGFTSWGQSPFHGASAGLVDIPALYPCVCSQPAAHQLRAGGCQLCLGLTNTVAVLWPPLQHFPQIVLQAHTVRVWWQTPSAWNSHIRRGNTFDSCIKTWRICSMERPVLLHPLLLWHPIIHVMPSLSYPVNHQKTI